MSSANELPYDNDRQLREAYDHIAFALAKSRKAIDTKNDGMLEYWCSTMIREMEVVSKLMEVRVKYGSASVRPPF